MFLTTQYLEEADVLADRVGIIDQGRIVAEGTPEALKAEIGRPRSRSCPPTPASATALRDVLAPLRRARSTRRPARSRCGCERGAEELADVVRALDAEDVRIAHLQLHSPTLDDVFLAKTGRKLERRRRRRRGEREAVAA